MESGGRRTEVLQSLRERMTMRYSLISSDRRWWVKIDGFEDGRTYHNLLAIVGGQGL